MNAGDRQVGGTHYRNMAIQPIDFIISNHLGFCEGCVIKYVCRWRAKGGIDDIRKAAHYLDFLWENMAARNDGIRRVAKYREDRITPERFNRENGIPHPAAGVIRHIWCWSLGGGAGELRSARDWLNELLANAQSECVDMD